MYLREPGGLVYCQLDEDVDYITHHDECRILYCKLLLVSTHEDRSLEIEALTVTRETCFIGMPSHVESL